MFDLYCVIFVFQVLYHFLFCYTNFLQKVYFIKQSYAITRAISFLWHTILLLFLMAYRVVHFPLLYYDFTYKDLKTEIRLGVGLDSFIL